MAELSSGPPTRSGGTQLLQDQIKELILRLDLSAGDAMPTEAELATRLNVGRNSVREAIKALQAVGIVEVRRGRGMYVGKMSLGALVDELTFHTRITLRDGRSGLAELTEVREALESGLAQRMIIREQGPDLRELGQVLETMEQEARAGRISPLSTGSSTRCCSGRSATRWSVGCSARSGTRSTRSSTSWRRRRSHR